MKTFIVLFRGINVGGNNKLPMKLLVPLLENNGFTNVSSYIQSGNIILDSINNPTLTIKTLILKDFNLSLSIIALAVEDFINIRVNNPYSSHDGKLVHCYICKSKPILNSAYISKYKSENEEVTLIHHTLYLYAPNGIGCSKLVKNVEKCLGVASTGRNLNTINKLFTMLSN